VVCLHGFLGDGTDWSPLAAALATTANVVAIDLPGHGHSPLPPTPLSLAAAAAAVDATVRALGLSTASLLGYSMGGRVALAAALARLPWIDALILESASPGLADPAARAARRAHDDAIAAHLLTAGTAAFLDRWYAQPLFASLAARSDLLAACVAARAALAPATVARVLVELSPGLLPSALDALPTLTLPTLIIAGALDPKYVAISADLAARLPTAARWVCPAAGHNVHLEAPAPFAARLGAFLEGE